jgi:hypothetical protein
MTPEVASRTHGLLNGMLESCHAIERLVSDGRDQQRLRLEVIETTVTEALSAVLHEHPGAQGASLGCSFCGKKQAEVAKLIAGPSVYICDECIHLCSDIIAEERRTAAAGPGDEGPAMALADSDEAEEPSSFRRSVPPSGSDK